MDMQIVPEEAHPSQIHCLMTKVTGPAVLGHFPVVAAWAALDIRRLGLVKWNFKIGDETIHKSVRYTF
jgi:hypothetical protein